MRALSKDAVLSALRAVPDARIMADGHVDWDDGAYVPRETINELFWGDDVLTAVFEDCEGPRPVRYYKASTYFLTRGTKKRGDDGHDTLADEARSKRCRDRKTLSALR